MVVFVKIFVIVWQIVVVIVVAFAVVVVAVAAIIVAAVVVMMIVVAILNAVKVVGIGFDGIAAIAVGDTNIFEMLIVIIANINYL